MPTQDDITRQLEEIKADCSYQNWDGEDGLPPTEAALTRAEKCATMHLGSGFATIHLGPLNDGGMDVELSSVIEGKQVRVVFEIGPDGTLKGGTARISGKRP